MKYQNIPEEELKNRVGQDYFCDYDYNKIMGNLDFCLSYKTNTQRTLDQLSPSLLWAEVKRNKTEIVDMFAQLILTIGKEKTFNKHFPPAFLGVFDDEKIAFVPYEKVSNLFLKNDFNWNVAPSNHNTKEFAQIKELINETLKREQYLFYFGEDDKDLKSFIKENLAKGSENSKIQIGEENFVSIFHRWQKEIKPIIDIDFDKDEGYKFLDANFFLADLFVDDKDTTTISDDVSIRDDLFVVFKNEGYEIKKENLKALFDSIAKIKNIPVYENFWKRYKRPPLKEAQDYILERKDLLVPQDFRERKGAFFTPQKWVNLSQKYIKDVLGENWQKEYYIWDCAAGTGNLLVGLTNSRNIYASTLDQGDVNAMKELNKSTEKMLKDHIFQFDFLNDEFFNKYRIIKSKEEIYDDGKHEITADKKQVTIKGKEYEIELLEKSKLPQELQKILRDPQKRKKLLIYINPPYAEAGNSSTMMGTGEHKAKVATDNKTYLKYKGKIGKASNEIFAQFLIRIYKEIPDCIIANFSKLKSLQAPNFLYFRKEFQAKLERLFLMPADTFDNVKGSFPIGFFVWNTGGGKKIRKNILKRLKPMFMIKMVIV